MILWVRGKRGIGKTTLAKQIQASMPHSILLDGDSMRECITKDLGFTDEDRLENNLRIAGLAKKLSEQGHNVIVATICPAKIKKAVYYESKCRFIDL